MWCDQAAARYRGQGTAAIRPTTIKLDQDCHQISTGGPPSYFRRSPVRRDVAKIFYVAKCGDQFSASADYNC